MDTVLQAFLTWQFLFFCIAIGAVVFVLRQIAEYVITNWTFASKESKLWRDLVLPISPILLGSVGAVLLKQYPYPAEIVSAGGRFVFGLVAGFSSSFIVRMYTAFLQDKISELSVKLTGLNPKDTVNVTNMKSDTTVSVDVNDPGKKD